MQPSAVLLGLLCLGRGVRSYPDRHEVQAGPTPCPFSAAAVAARTQKQKQKRLLFDPLTAPIEVTGEHAFVAPDFGAGDQRGPCPGLNALANHGYISRDGVTGLLEATVAINTVWGMGLDLGGVLAVLGTVFVGSPLSLDPGFSIGGPDPGVHNLLGDLFGLLGTPRGLVGAHNILESDSSATRADLYVTGDAATMALPQFQALYDLSGGGGDDDDDGNYDMDLFAAYAATRFDETVATNPQFYYGPFTGMIARNAGYIFSGRMFANHSTENLTGLLSMRPYASPPSPPLKALLILLRTDRKTLMSIYGVQKVNGSLVYNMGHERIPENWYRRPVDYGIVDLNLDVLDFILKDPRLGR